MASRLELHNELLTLCNNAYYQPPESVKLTYPCIVYKRSTGDVRFANNSKYSYKRSYELTVIDRDPDRLLAERILMHFKMCREDRSFVSENLYHNILTLYY